MKLARDKIFPPVPCLFLFVCLICFFIAGLIADFIPGLAGRAYGQSQFDTDDEQIIFQEEGWPDMEDKTHLTQDDPLHPEPTWTDQFFEESTVTLGYRFAHGVEAGPKIIDNNVFVRLEYDTLFRDYLFLKFDGKCSVHPKTDHRADAEDRDVLVDAWVRQAFVQAGYDNFSLKIGHQINVWGKADTVAITDVVSARDLSEFIFIRLEDARLGQFMISGNFYSRYFNTFLFYSPLPETDREPATNSRYDRAPESQGTIVVLEKSPQFGDSEFGVKIDKIISKTDVSLMAGRFFSNSARYAYQGYDLDAKPVATKTYPAYTMAGAALSHAWQQFLFKMELAYKFGFALQGNDADGLFRVEKKDVIDAAIGVEYNANDRYQMSVELSNRHIRSGGSGLTQDCDEKDSAFYYMFQKDFLNQTLDFEYNFYCHVQKKDRFHRFQLTYDLTDSLEIIADYTVFNARDKDSLMWQYQKEDRISLEIKSFF
ncbi:DUF1302 family protein [Desulfobacula phenolica]|uniref:Beta-barrel porin 2 n=1 Tax=Desulfobacula phenolica TaxID=90732 RepID=A0A1H2J0C8_9BACT|nr:DUF1302 family protein [Desulfobacula phenolica]SDU49616.1 hypothetical protein SAMN04487931_11042 [Desulfobacula phenolica]